MWPKGWRKGRSQVEGEEPGRRGGARRKGRSQEEGSDKVPARLDVGLIMKSVGSPRRTLTRGMPRWF